MKLALYDVESTGLDPATDVAIEVAIVLYDTKHAAPVATYASLIQHGSNAAEATNRIPVAMLADAPTRDRVWPRVAGAFQQADVICAHNADFDRSMTPESVASLKPWADTCTDMVWPKASKRGEGLVSLALSHGVGVASAHRALADVMTMALLFQRVQELGHDVDAMVAHALRPKVRVIGKQSRDQNDIAKAHGFRWDGERYEWWRNMPREDIAGLPFAVKEAT